MAFLAWLQSLLTRQPPVEAMGERGENLAAAYLRDQGFKIVIRNFRCPAGEIDIIARDGPTLVFVEVKTRAYEDPAPEDQVHAAKQRKLTTVAKMYLARYGPSQPPARFDVVAVVWPKGREPLIRHVPHAFEAAY